MDTRNLKASLTVIGIIVVLMMIIVIPLLLFDRKEDNKNFPDYKDFSIKDSDVSDKSSESYKEIKNRLESDYNFAKEALISNYNYKNYTSADLKQMLWNYIFAFELNNKKYLSSLDKIHGEFCMRSRYVISSFEELYNVKISTDVEYLQGYFEYVTYNKNKYCFSYSTVANDYSNDIKILVDGVSSKNGIVTTNLYLYEYYTTQTDSELSYISSLKSAISNTNINEANNIVLNKLNGKVTHKQLEFKIKNNADFFKYQILSSKNLDY